MIELKYYVSASENFPQESALFSTFEEAQEHEEMLVIAELIYSCTTVYTSPSSSLSLARHLLAGMKAHVAAAQAKAASFAAWEEDKEQTPPA